MSVFGWIRARFYGSRESQDRVSGALRDVTPLGGFGRKYRTPFDEPPAEKIELDPDLPWELRD
jgi:hypothetical protein